jgi:hypothetical protein
MRKMIESSLYRRHALIHHILTLTVCTGRLGELDLTKSI